MEKNIILLITVILVIVIISVTSYNKIKKEKNSIIQFNQIYEEYNDKELKGLDIVSLINRAVNNNESNNIIKNSDNIYILDDKYSVEIYITFDNITYPMERLKSSGLDTFIRYFGDVKFNCTDVKYHQKTGRIASLTFEAIDYK